MLVECKPSFHSVFVSHQWLGKHHPDEKGSQFSVLQKAFENIINGHIEVELDIPLQWSGYTRSISKADRKELRRGYVWLDWFSIPQIEVKEQGVEDEQMRGDVLLAVQSIPFYVETCKLFVALVPQLQHNDLHTECNYCTWLNRGWCRLEIWCNLLSHHNEAPFVVIQDCDHAEFSMPVHWVRESAHEGYFTVESDRSRVAQVMQTAFESKIASLRIEEQTKQRTQLFRYLLAGKSRLLGLPTPSLTPESFPKYFGFDSLESALKQKTGMVATACAVLAEDTATLRWLAKAGAELNPQLPGIMEVGLTRGWTPLHLAVSHCSDPGIVQELLNLRANPNSCNRGGMPALGCCTSVAAVDLMLFHRADANFCQQPGGLGIIDHPVRSAIRSAAFTAGTGRSEWPWMWHRPCSFVHVGDLCEWQSKSRGACADTFGSWGRCKPRRPPPRPRKGLRASLSLLRHFPLVPIRGEAGFGGSLCGRGELHGPGSCITPRSRAVGSAALRGKW